MNIRSIYLPLITLLMVLPLSSISLAQQGDVRIFNTVKLKIANGEQVVGGTVDTPDPAIYCAMANSGFDFMWIEMQHSPLSYSQVADMIWACKDAPAIPFIRIPAATEGDIQKATDIGALGIIVPMVDAVEEVDRDSEDPSSFLKTIDQKPERSDASPRLEEEPA